MWLPSGRMCNGLIRKIKGSQAVLRRDAAIHFHLDAWVNWYNTNEHFLEW